MKLTYRQIRIMHGYSSQVGMEFTGIGIRKDRIIVVVEDGSIKNQEICYDMYFFKDGKSRVELFVGGMLYNVYTFDSGYKHLKR